MKVYINPGHDLEYDSGAVHADENGDVDLRECDVAARIGALTKRYLEAAGCEVRMLQSDNLCNDSDHPDRPVAVCDDANDWGADVFVSIHCNSAADSTACGTETLIYSTESVEARNLAGCIQHQVVRALGTADRGLKTRPDLIVLKDTTMPSVLVETAFISNFEDVEKLVTHQDDFARAIARGVTDYELEVSRCADY